MKETLKDKRGIKYGLIETSLNGKTVVYDKNNVRLGEIRPEGNYLVAYNKNNVRMGKWYENDNCTYDKNNRRLGKGNMLLGMYFE